MEKCPRASPRSRQQCRSGSASLEEENATRRSIPRNEAAAQLREAFGTAGARKSRSGPTLSQAAAQAHGARGLLSIYSGRLVAARHCNRDLHKKPLVGAPAAYLQQKAPP